MAASEKTIEKQHEERQKKAVSNRAKRAAAKDVWIEPLTDKQRQKRERLEQDPEAWICEIAGPKSGIESPLTYSLVEQQLAMLDGFNETMMYGGDELVLASRGEGKTTYLRLECLRSMSKGVIDFIAFIGATGDDAQNSRVSIADVVYRSEPFIELYPEVAVPANRCYSAPQLAFAMTASGERFDTGESFHQVPVKFTWSQEGLIFPDVPGSPSGRSLMLFRGADKAIRGLNIFGKRPKLVVMDDLDSPDTVNNPDLAKKVIDRVNDDIGGLGTQTEPLARLMLATLPRQGCGVVHHFASDGGTFVVKRYKYLIEKPLREDMWMQYVKLRQTGKRKGDKYGRRAHNYYLKNRDEMEAGHKVSNPNRFKPRKLADGSQLQVSALQNYYDEWADKGEMFCRCELDNELIETEQIISSKIETGHVTACEGSRNRREIESTTDIITRGIDVRKVELHHATIAGWPGRENHIPDYDVRVHGSSETTVEQAEELIYKALHALTKEQEASPLVDENGHSFRTDLTLIDKGWKGNWTEDGAIKTWVTQPVETFCRERGLRRFLPAKGAPRYESPKPSDDVIVGDNWHMNRGAGAGRSCTEVIWSAEHYHSLVEELFVTDDEAVRFELFLATDGVQSNHRRLAEHVTEGAEELAEMRRRATKSRKPRFRRDHWWDSLAMALVARSIEVWFRANLKPPAPRSSIHSPSPTPTEEIGAR